MKDGNVDSDGVYELVRGSAEEVGDGSADENGGNEATATTSAMGKTMAAAAATEAASSAAVGETSIDGNCEDDMEI